MFEEKVLLLARDSDYSVKGRMIAKSQEPMNTDLVDLDVSSSSSIRCPQPLELPVTSTTLPSPFYINFYFILNYFFLEVLTILLIINLNGEFFSF